MNGRPPRALVAPILSAPFRGADTSQGNTGSRLGVWYKYKNGVVAGTLTLEMASTLEKHLAAALHSRISRGLPDDIYPTSDLALVDFTSNDYLALSKSSELKQALLQNLQSTPDILGSGGSRALNHNNLYEALETRLQNFFNEGKGELEAIVFNSGQEANIGFFSCVPQQGDFIVYDLHVHASIHDGMRASKARSFSFAHNSVQGLQKVLARLGDDHPELVSGGVSLFIALESIYSMDGSVVPLTQIVEMVDLMFPSKNAYIMVDEAHSTGLYGPQGRGLVSMLGLQDRVFARLHTFSKALSAAGGKPSLSCTHTTPTYGVTTTQLSFSSHRSFGGS